jgi:hypothetical protein
MADFDPDAYLAQKVADKKQTESTFDPDAYLAHKAKDTEHSDEEYEDSTYSDNLIKHGRDYADKYKETTRYNNREAKGFDQNQANKAKARKDTLEAVESNKRKNAEQDKEAAETLPEKAYGAAAAGVRTALGVPGGLVSGALEMLGAPKAADAVDEQVRNATPLNAPGQRYAGAVADAAQAAHLEGLAPEVGTVGRAAKALPEASEGVARLQGAAKVAEKAALPTVAEDAAAEAAQRGYKVAPSNVTPSTTGKLLEATAGGTNKVAAELSHDNQTVTTAGIREDLKLPPKTPLTPEKLDSYRSKQVDDGYKPLYALKDDVRLTPEATKKLQSVVQEQQAFLSAKPTHIADLDRRLAVSGGTYTTEQAVDLIRGLRSRAKTLAKSGDVDTAEISKVYRSAADAIEDSMGAALASSKDKRAPALLTQYQAARKNIAKSYSVEEALTGKGEVDARVFAKHLENGVPLEGNMLSAAKFARAFPREAAPPSEATTARGIKESILHGVQNKIIQSDLGQRKLAGVPQRESVKPAPPPTPLALEEGPSTNGDAFTPRPPPTRDLLSLEEKSAAPSKTEQPKPAGNEIDFQLRQEVLQHPEIKGAVDKFRAEDTRLQKLVDNAINPHVRAKAKTQQDALRKEFLAGMQQLGINNPAQAHGLNRPLYESGMPTQLPVQKTYDPRTMRDAQ